MNTSIYKNNSIEIEIMNENDYIVIKNNDVVEINNIVITDSNYYMLLHEIRRVLDNLKISLID